MFIVKNRKAAEKKKKFEKVIKRKESDRLRYQAKKEAKIKVLWSTRGRLGAAFRAGATTSCRKTASAMLCRG